VPASPGENLFDEPNAADAVQPLNVECDMGVVLRFANGLLEGLEPLRVASLGSGLRRRGAACTAERVVALEVLFPEESVNGLAAPAAEVAAGPLLEREPAMKADEGRPGRGHRGGDQWLRQTHPRISGMSSKCSRM
jgi:hypothetical protein